MYQVRFRAMVSLMFLMVTLIVGCATVPREVVELSYVMGQDLTELHRSYRLLVSTHFGNIRNQMLSFLEHEWKPVYLKKFIKEGDLAGLATQSDPNAAFEGVQIWVEVAMEEIDRKRRELVEPIDAKEKSLLSDVDDAFAQVRAANSAVTAHLNSLRRVQEVQDEGLRALNLDGLRERINDGLVEASNVAARGIDKLAEAEGILDKAEETQRKLKDLKK